MLALQALDTGGMGYGRPKPDVEGERILEYALAFDLLLGNTCFKKRDSHLITYTQIDFILFRRTMRKLITGVKVIPGEEVALQHQLLVCDMRIDVPPKSKRKFTPCLKVWKLKDPQTSSHFQEVFNLHVCTSAGVADGVTEDIWNNIKTGLLKTTEEVCGTTGPPVGVVKSGGGMNTWKMPLLPSRQLSRPGRHHTMQPNKMPDMQCTMLIKKQTRRSTRILTKVFRSLPLC